jgi:hypothetical protein
MIIRDTMQIQIQLLHFFFKSAIVWHFCKTFLLCLLCNSSNSRCIMFEEGGGGGGKGHKVVRYFFGGKEGNLDEHSKSWKDALKNIFWTIGVVKTIAPPPSHFGHLWHLLNKETVVTVLNYWLHCIFFQGLGNTLTFQ